MVKKLALAFSVMALQACNSAPQFPVAVEVVDSLPYGVAAEVTATLGTDNRPRSCSIKAKSETCAAEAYDLCFSPSSRTRRANFCM